MKAFAVHGFWVSDAEQSATESLAQCGVWLCGRQYHKCPLCKIVMIQDGGGRGGWSSNFVFPKGFYTYLKLNLSSYELVPEMFINSSINSDH